MLSIILIYYVGKKFYDLAGQFDKNKWVYAISSIVLYYASSFILGLILGVLDIYVFEWGIDWDSSIGIKIGGIAVGIITLWGFYTYLEKKWDAQKPKFKDEIDKIGKDLTHN